MNHHPLWLIAVCAIGCSGSTPTQEAETPNDAATATASSAARETPSSSASVTAIPTVAETATPAAPTATATASVAPTAAPSMTASAAPTASAASEPAGANLRVGSMTVDGLQVNDVACRADGLGILGSMLVVGGISKKKAALLACAPAGDSPRVEWTAAGGKMTNVKAKASTPAIAACVTKALTGTPAPFQGECAATLVLKK